MPRCSAGVTTMLNFFTTSNGFRSTLPVVSNLTAMNVWDGVCMCCIYASLLEFVLVNYVGRKRSDWPLPVVYQNKDQDYKRITQVRNRTFGHGTRLATSETVAMARLVAFPVRRPFRRLSELFLPKSPIPIPLVPLQTKSPRRHKYFYR